MTVDDGSFKPVPLAVPQIAASQSAMSNALLIGASRSATGHPLFVAGPQVGYFFPEFFMEVDLDGGGFGTRGALFPGCAVRRDRARHRRRLERDLVAGRQHRRLRRDALRRRHALHLQGHLPGDDDVQRRRAERVGSPDQPVVFRETVHGPVEGYATVGGTRVAVSLERSTRGRELLSAQSFYKLDTNQVHVGEELPEDDGRGRVLVQLVLRRRQGHRPLLERAPAGARARHGPGAADRRVGRLRLARLPHAGPARAGDQSARAARSSTGTTSPPRAWAPRTTTGPTARSSASSSCSSGSTRRRASSRSRTSSRR